MYANCYGLDGVTKLIQILKSEIAADAAQAGVADLKSMSRGIVSNPPHRRFISTSRLTYYSSILARLTRLSSWPMLEVSSWALSLRLLGANRHIN